MIDADQVGRRRREALDAQPLVQEQRGDLGAGEEVVQVVVGPLELIDLLAELGVDRGELLVERAQLLGGGLQLLVGRLQLLVHRHRLFVRRAQLLVG